MIARLPEWLDPSPWLRDPEPAAEDVVRALRCDSPGPRELVALLSPAARSSLEALAQKARALTQRHFGRVITLYAPLYLSNYCSSGCVYCGFASDRGQPRRRLDLSEADRELAVLSELGFQEVLLLTGERGPRADFEYLLQCVSLAARRFHFVGIETFPMEVEEYHRMAEAGCSGVTLYQETYDPARYDRYHRWGPKKDFLRRIEAPNRALEAGIRTVGLGALLGLSDPVFEAVCLLRHVEHLQHTHWRSGVALSFPRIRPQNGGFSAPFPVDETRLAQMIFAFRIVLPQTPLLLSTRERPGFRDGMAGLGISKMSAGSRTTVGGYAEEERPEGGQFAVSDERSVDEVCAMLASRHLEPVFKNWDRTYRDTLS